MTNTWKDLLKSHHFDVPRLRGLSEPLVLRLKDSDDILIALDAYDASRDDRRTSRRKPIR